MPSSGYIPDSRINEVQCFGMAMHGFATVAVNCNSMAKAGYNAKPLAIIRVHKLWSLTQFKLMPRRRRDEILIYVQGVYMSVRRRYIVRECDRRARIMRRLRSLALPEIGQAGSACLQSLCRCSPACLKIGRCRAQ